MGSGHTPKVSVILPVYNVEGYIGRCIESLQAQTLTELEFIFVDDCSTDGSMAAVEAWAAQDERVRILRNEENLGAGPTRNCGIEAARGEYLSFVDPDDYVAPDFYELLYAAATANGGHDIAKGIRITKGLDGSVSSENSRRLNRRIKSRLRTKAPLYPVFMFEHQTAIYAHSLFDAGARNGTTRKSQDTTFLLAACLMTTDVVLEDAAVYNYIAREGSTVNSASIELYMGELDSLAEKARLLEEKVGDQYAQEYLDIKASICLTKYYSGLLNNPSLSSTIDRYSARFADIIASYPVLNFLKIEDPACGALLGEAVVLPTVSRLPPEQKSEGVRSWLVYSVRQADNPHLYADGCAKAMADFIKHLVKERGPAGLKDAYAQIAGQLESLPAGVRATLWLKTCRQLASKHNLQAAVEHFKAATANQSASKLNGF